MEPSGLGVVDLAMLTAALLTVAFVLSIDPTLVLSFDRPDSIEKPVNCRIIPQQPLRTITLIAADPSRPRLWYAPVGTFAAPNGTLIWYQRVDTDEKVFSDQRTLCLGVWQANSWIMPPFREESPAWGGPNNVVMRRSPKKPTWGGFNVFQILWVNDHFEMLYWDQPEEGDAGLLRSSSPNGKDWSPPPPRALFTERNDAFTVLSKEGRYLMYQTMLEDWPDKPYKDNLPQKRRVIGLRTSSDLDSWSPQEVLLRPDDQDPPETEFYLFKAFPYRGAYVGLLMKYFADPEMPGVHSQRIKTEVLWSADALTWQRPFRDMDFGFWTYADPFEQDGRVYLPAGQKNALVLHSFGQNRLLGVATMNATEEASFVTASFAMPPGDLALDVDARDGWVEIQLLDAGGSPALDSPPCRISDIDAGMYRLSWDGRGTGDLPLWLGRLRFRMRNARVFAVVTDQPSATR